MWAEFTTLDYDSDDFAELGRDFEAEGTVRTGRVGRAESKLFAMRPAVDFAVSWLDAHRV